MSREKRTKAEERAHTELLLELSEAELWMREFRLKEAFVPGDWAELDKSAPTRPPQSEVTLMLDKDLVKWFRVLGDKWDQRINSVLRIYMLSVISREVESRGNLDWKGDEI